MGSSPTPTESVDELAQALLDSISGIDGIDPESVESAVANPPAHSEVLSEYESLEAEILRRHYLAKPALWALDNLKCFIWSGQEKVLNSVFRNRKTAVISCHEAGKSFISALAICAWLTLHRPGEAAAVTSAPSGRQVRAILWNEIRQLHGRGHLLGRVNQTEWHAVLPDSRAEKLIAFGQKPADLDTTGFQGVHLAKDMLVVFDEACGMPKQLWTAAETLIANDFSRFLAIGNPDDPNSEFAKICMPGSGWNVIRISAFDTPNFTGEALPKSVRDQLIGRTYVEERRKAWAPTWAWTSHGDACVPPPGLKEEDIHPLWSSKVLARFPLQNDAHGLIPLSWIEGAKERTLPSEGPNVLGVDCGAGGDSSTTAHRLGSVLRIISEDRNPDTMQTTGKVVEERRRTGATVVKVDKIGIGAGIVDRGVELGEPFLGINVGEAAICICSSMQREGSLPPPRLLHYDECNVSRFANLKAQAWWGVRDRFESGDIDLDPNDEDTASELASLRYKRTSKGQIQIESKDEAKRRGVNSPNRAEALMLAFAPEPPPAKPRLRGGAL